MNWFYESDGVDAVDLQVLELRSIVGVIHTVAGELARLITGESAPPVSSLNVPSILAGATMPNLISLRVLT